MATLTMYWFGRGLEAFKSGEIDWEADTIKVALTTAAYTPNQGTHQFFNDVTNEVSGTGYTAGGATIGTRTLTYESGNLRVVLDGDDVEWDPSTITARNAVIYKDTGTAGTSPLIGYGVLAEDQSSEDARFAIEWAAGGILRTTAEAQT